MPDYKKYILRKGEHELGILWCDIRDNLLTPAQYEEFWAFMQGQTMGVLGELGEDKESVGYVYTGDFERFLRTLK